MGWLLRFLGGWFFLGGLLFAAVGLQSASIVGLVSGGVLAIAIGLPLLTFRRGCDIDRLQVVKWWGLLVPWRRARYVLADFERVALRREDRRQSVSNATKQRRYMVYPVQLEGQQPLVLREGLTLREARVLAEEVAKYLDLPLADSSSGKTQVRAAKELDLSLAEQLQQAGISLKVPRLPPQTKLQLTASAGAVRIELPRRARFARSMLLWGPTAVGALLGALIAWQVALEASYSAVLMLGLAGIMLLIWGRDGLERIVVYLDKERLEVEQRTLWTRRKSIERPALEELHQVYKPFALFTGVDQPDSQGQAVDEVAYERSVGVLDAYGLSCRYVLAISDSQRIAIPVYSSAQDAQFVHDLMQYGLGRQQGDR